MSTDQKIDKLFDHILQIKETIAANTVTLDKNTQDIADHIKRTNILEQQMQFFTALAKVLAAIAATTAFVWTAIQILRFVRQFL